MLAHEVTVPLHDLPKDAVVTGTATIEAADGWSRHHRQPPPEPYEFSSQRLEDLLNEFANIEKYRQDKVIGSVTITKIVFPAR